MLRSNAKFAVEMRRRKHPELARSQWVIRLENLSLKGKKQALGCAMRISIRFSTSSQSCSLFQEACSRLNGLALALPLLICVGSLLASSCLADSPAAPSSGWTPTASLSIPRSVHTATLLPDGRVLVAGGSSIGVVTASAELYDPATETWTTTGSMSVARAGHRAVLLNSGQVMVVGGSNQKTTEFYDPATGLWTRGPNISGRQTGGFTLTLLTDGRVLLAGRDDRKSQVYDPTNDSRPPAASMVFVQSTPTATLLSDGTVLVAGGGASPAIRKAEIYDPATNTWTPTGSMNKQRAFHL